MNLEKFTQLLGFIIFFQGIVFSLKFILFAKKSKAVLSLSILLFLLSVGALPLFIKVLSKVAKPILILVSILQAYFFYRYFKKMISLKLPKTISSYAKFNITYCFFLLSFITTAFTLKKILPLALLVNISSLIVMYWIIFNCISQNSIESVLIHNSSIEIGNTRITHENDELTEIFERIHLYLEKNESYKNNELTMNNVATAIGISTCRVSRAVNHVQKENFRTYINKMRIQKVLAYSNNESYKNYTLEAIGSEMGFKSRSTFYRVFKKEMQCSPVEYIRKHRM